MSSPKFCKQCGKPIDANKGRADRQYCDERCKNKFHNEKNMQENSELQRIDLAIKEGFDFDYHTHHIISKIKKNEFIFCFDYGYCMITKESYKVVKAFEYREE